MELYELKYFLGVAHRQNIHRASEDLRVSPASLSKAVQRLEEELGVTLFSREGRNIKLTDHGITLMRRAIAILSLEESTRIELKGGEGYVNPVIAGPESLLTEHGLNLIHRIQKKHRSSRFEFRTCSEEHALKFVVDGEAHLAVISREAPVGLASASLSASKFVTCVGKSHALANFAKGGSKVPVEELLKHDFVCPAQPIFGDIGNRPSPDGWRDDQFPRKIRFVTTSLKMLSELVDSGLAIAYLPAHLAKKEGWLVLKVTGCPYTCEQSIQLVARDPGKHGWLRWLFD